MSEWQSQNNALSRPPASKHIPRKTFSRNCLPSGISPERVHLYLSLHANALHHFAPVYWVPISFLMSPCRNIYPSPTSSIMKSVFFIKYSHFTFFFRWNLVSFRFPPSSFQIKNWLTLYVFSFHEIDNKFPTEKSKNKWIKQWNDARNTNIEDKSPPLSSFSVARVSPFFEKTRQKWFVKILRGNGKTFSNVFSPPFKIWKFEKSFLPKKEKKPLFSL